MEKDLNLDIGLVSLNIFLAMPTLSHLIMKPGVDEGTVHITG